MTYIASLTFQVSFTLVPEDTELELDVKLEMLGAAPCGTFAEV